MGSLASCVPSQSCHWRGGRASCEIFTELSSAFFCSNCDPSFTSQLCQPQGVATVKPTHNEPYPPAGLSSSPGPSSPTSSQITAPCPTHPRSQPMGVGPAPQWAEL